MESTGNIQISNSTLHSDLKLHEYLSNELNQKNDTRNAKEKLNSINEKGDNLIYKLKLEKSKGDSLFSSLNDNFKIAGSTLGVRTSSYLDHVRRFNESKSLVSNATLIQRNRIRSITDLITAKVWRHRYNYLLKGVLVSSFLYNLCKANENRNLFNLRHSNPKIYDTAKFYYNAGLSFAFALCTFALI